MKRIKFSLRNLILFVTVAGLYLGYSQARRHSSLGVAHTLDEFGYVVNTPDSLCDLIWQRSPRVRWNDGSSKFYPLLDHWWQMSPERVIIHFDVRQNAGQLTVIHSPSEETTEILEAGERLKTFGVKEILVGVAYRSEPMSLREFESQSLATGIAKPYTAPDDEQPVHASGPSNRRAKKEGARPEAQDALPRSIARQAIQADSAR